MLLEYQFRSVTADDFEFYRSLHHEVFREYVEPIWGWDQADQDERVKRAFEETQAQIIRYNDQDIGFVQIKDYGEYIFISELWIVPKFQNKGLGTAIISDVLKSAQKSNKYVRLHVLRTNPSYKLYKRLGFMRDGEVDEGGFFMIHECKNVA